MLGTSFIAFALAATGLALPQVAVPEGYRKVYITSMVDTKYIVVPTSVKNGSTVVVQTNTNKPEHVWYLTSGPSKLQLANTNFCLDAGAKSNWKDMGNLWITDCADTAAGQKFDVMADGRIKLVDSKPEECVDLQYMKATANNPVGLYACAGLGNTGAKDKGINWPLVNATTF